MSPKIVDKEQKRRLIVEASLRVFASNGYEATRTIDIAKEAGIGKGTIYEYFRSKDEIVEAIFEYLFFNYEQHLQQLTQESKPPVEAILESFKRMMEEASIFVSISPVSCPLTIISAYALLSFSNHSDIWRSSPSRSLKVLELHN